ncbi:MAG: hypothetical protein VXZ82_23020 [Planctomycetota bacterium]|nr:hypothetical protein [Planctomycetota bacterium]
MWTSIWTYVCSLSPGQAIFWFCSVAVLLGSIYPDAMQLLPENTRAELLGEKASECMHSAYRSTLLCVILL